MTWGWGAIRVGHAEKGWRCPHCNKVNRAGDTEANIGLHTYLNGLELCTRCARALYEANAAWLDAGLIAAGYSL